MPATAIRHGRFYSSVNVQVWIRHGSKESRRDILALISIEAWCLALPQASFGGSIDFSALQRAMVKQDTRGVWEGHCIVRIAR